MLRPLSIATFLSLLLFACQPVVPEAEKEKMAAQEQNEVAPEPEEDTFSEDDRNAIQQLMDSQELAWNEGDLEGFMAAYWQSDEMMFIGKSGVTKGWQATLDRYKKGYPDLEAMGKLTFELLSLDYLGNGHAFMTGKWHLARTEDDLGGHFSLIWKKMEPGWRIIADHSS